MSNSDRPASPPRAAERLAALVLPEAAREEIMGDLHERFVDRMTSAGEKAARRWYLRQALGFLVRVPFVRAHEAAADASRGFFAGSGWTADLRDAWRAVVRERSLTATVVLVLGLATGAAAAVFSVADAVLLRSLPYADPDALVMLWDEYPEKDGTDQPRPVTRLHYHAWRARTDLFASAGIFESSAVVIDRGRWTEQIESAMVSADLLPALGVPPLLGRLFTTEDDVVGAPQVAILSHELWQSWLGGDRSVIGRRVDLNGQPTEIVGVMPREFWFYDPYAATRSYTASGASTAQLWQPLGGLYADEQTYPRYRMVGRVRPGVTPDALAAALADEERRLALPNAAADGRMRALPLSEQVRAKDRPRLIGLLAAVGLVLLVATVNLAGLLVARFDARRPEFALRVALGAGRGRILRAIAVHGALLSLGGGTLGVALAALAIPPLVEIMPRGLPLVHRISLNAAVVGFAGLVSVATGILAAMVAALRLSSGSPASAMKGTVRGVAGGGRRTIASAMTGLEVAVSLVLLIGATLLLRSLILTYRADAGFDRRQAMTFQSVLMLSAPGAAPDLTFFERLEASIADIPGVVAAGSGSILPFSRWGSTALVRLPSGAAQQDPVRADYRLVSAGYFDALRISIDAGRPFGTRDVRGGAPVAIVNRTFADRYLTSGAAIGQRIAIVRGTAAATEREIVGVSANVKESSLFAAPRPIVYVPIAQSPTPMRQFVVRTAGPPADAIDAVRQAAADIDRRQPLQDFVSLGTLVDQSLEDERFYAVVGAALAGIAVVLALTGLYGVVAFAVRQRRHEVGVRIALGATRPAVFRLILADGMRPVAAGILVGCITAAAASGLLRSLIHGLPTVDTVSYGIAASTFALVAAIACLLPARRAAAIDPVRTLNELS